MERITDLDDPRIADYRHLNDAAARAAAGRDQVGTGCAIVEGAVALQVVLRAGIPLRSMLLTPKRADLLGDVAHLVPEEVPVYVAERDLLARVVGFDLHRGVLASATRARPADPATLLRRRGTVVVAEAVNDHENLGALFRNAAAFGLDGVLLDDRTADPLYRRSIRVSSGWAAVLPHCRIGPLPDGYSMLRAHGFRILALTPGVTATALDVAAECGWLDGAVAFVLGAEGPGLSTRAIEQADASVRVPMAGGVDSLNVATSLAVVGAFAAARRSWST